MAGTTHGWRRWAPLLLVGLVAVVILDGPLGAWPNGTAGLAVLLGVIATAQRGPATAAGAALALAALLMPPAAVAGPLAALATWHYGSRVRALRPLMAALLGAGLGTALRSAMGWTLVPASNGPSTVVGGAHDLWWLLLEHMGLDIATSSTIGGLPLLVWSVAAWTPFYALGLTLVWREPAALPLVTAHALLAFGMLVAGSTPATATLSAIAGLAVLTCGRAWPAFAALLLTTALVNLALGPMSVPETVAPRMALDPRTLDALLRTILLAVLTGALAGRLWRAVPPAWRRLAALDPQA